MNDEVLSILNEQSKTLGRLEAGLSQLIGNGHPGLIKEMRDDIDTLKQTKNYAIGFGIGFTFLEGAYHYIMNRMGLR